jgi:hypothetical protein
MEFGLGMGVRVQVYLNLQGKEIHPSGQMSLVMNEKVVYFLSSGKRFYCFLR